MSAALTTNVDQRLLRTTKFPPEFNVKVDMKKVNNQLIKGWVTEEIQKILKNEDDVVSELVSNILDENRFPNIKELQIALTGFLDKDAAPFCQALWKLCVSAQNSPHGVPKELLEAKKAELAQAKAEEDRAREEATKRQEAERERDQEVARIRERERSERGRGRGGRGGRDFDRRPPRDSRSPPPRRRRDDDDFRRPPSGRADVYIPSKARRDDRPPRRPSPSYGRLKSRSRSRSRSPPPRRRRRDDSLSRSPPPRRRRNTSSERSSSRERGYGRRNDRPRGGNDRQRARSPAYRRRSPSPRRYRRRSPSYDRSRSPPTKRSRKASPSPARPSTSDSRSSATPQKSPPNRKKEKVLALDDLMSTNRRKDGTRRDDRRLSREPSNASASRSETPQTGGAEVAQRPKPQHRLSVSQQHAVNLFREKQLKLALLNRKHISRKDSVISH